MEKKFLIKVLSYKSAGAEKADAFRKINMLLREAQQNAESIRQIEPTAWKNYQQAKKLADKIVQGKITEDEYRLADDEFLELEGEDPRVKGLFVSFFQKMEQIEKLRQSEAFRAPKNKFLILFINKEKEDETFVNWVSSSNLTSKDVGSVLTVTTKVIVRTGKDNAQRIEVLEVKKNK